MTNNPAAVDIAAPLLAWFDEHGRHDLPWQQDRSPYRVWVSEIMLQQTQVTTVIPYFERFMSRFPDVASLAAASLDEILHLWTGLGYYARARNLHRAARIAVESHDGNLPEDFQSLVALPGIGRSTAGAILAQARSQRHPILDGNARRVLARYFGIEGDPSLPETQKRLWAYADDCTPTERVADYTQAIMDLGAGLCSRSKPRCDACPLATGCAALTTGRQGELPSPRRKMYRPHREAWALVVCCDDSVLLEQRAPDGLWGGLWCFPMFDSQDEAFGYVTVTLDSPTDAAEDLPPLQHAFTHFDLTIHPVLVSPTESASLAVDADTLRWYSLSQPPRVGLPKPVVALLDTLKQHERQRLLL